MFNDLSVGWSVYYGDGSADFFKRDSSKEEITIKSPMGVAVIGGKISVWSLYDNSVEKEIPLTVINKYPSEVRGVLRGKQKLRLDSPLIESNTEISKGSVVMIQGDVEDYYYVTFNGAWGFLRKTDVIAGYFKEGKASTTSNKLTQSQMEHNAVAIYHRLQKAGWTKKAICALLGNMHWESGSINPGGWEKDTTTYLLNGFGLVQWTNADKAKTRDQAINWITAQGYDKVDLFGQVDRILFEVDKTNGTQDGYQWAKCSCAVCNNMTFEAFTKSPKDAPILAEIFEHSYERAKHSEHDKRIEYAEYWHDTYFTNYN